jgi:hypothetical protein
VGLLCGGRTENRERGAAREGSYARERGNILEDVAFGGMGDDVRWGILGDGFVFAG